MGLPEMKDYYQILGVSRNAGQEEIKRAFRRMARLHHPDVSGEESDEGRRFKEINEAYEVLSDPERRRRYDLFGEDGPAVSAFDRGFGGFAGPFGDIFSIFFGRERARPAYAPRRGNDLLTVVELGLLEAYTGVTRKIAMPVNETCRDCGGSGLEVGYDHDLCPDCGGEGRITHSRRSSFGTFTSTATCRRCAGAGEINTHPCPFCEGRGIRRVEDELEVNIPAGVDGGDRIRLEGKGEPGQAGGPPGDLYAEVRIEEHETFTRHGSNLHAMVKIDISEAALGTDIDIPTLNGEERLHVPAGSQPGEVFRLRGKGMPGVRSRSVGDLYLTLEVEVPRKLNAEQKRLMAEFQRIEARKKGETSIVARLRKAMRP